MRIFDPHRAHRRRLRKTYGFKPLKCRLDHNSGVARNVFDDVWPLNGVRLAPTHDTNGWYIWAGGEMSAAADFFVPLCASCLTDAYPSLTPYLELPPGWRFLLAPGQEHVWFDPGVDLKPGS